MNELPVCFLFYCLKTEVLHDPRDPSCEWLRALGQDPWNSWAYLKSSRISSQVNCIYRFPSDVGHVYRGEDRYLGCGLFSSRQIWTFSHSATCPSNSALIGRSCGGCVWNLLPRSFSTSPKWPRFILLQGQPCQAVNRYRLSGMDHRN